MKGLVFSLREARWGFWLRWLFLWGGFAIGFEL